MENKDLEKSVKNILTEIGVKYKDEDLEACHRLRKGKNEKGPARTIVRYVNRRVCERALRNKKKLKDLSKAKKKDLGLGTANIFINESLCSAYRNIWWCAKQLHASKRIHAFFVSNGTVKIVVGSDDQPLPIYHKETIRSIFPNFNMKTGQIEK